MLASCLPGTAHHLLALLRGKLPEELGLEQKLQGGVESEIWGKGN